ncbi:uncharacterized protein B0I36DRAFT_315571 [Microdochium trichocladiopsis]|uniref:Uncharacterized protein n=1 Tax=Microdochium trichocladiopsis TaxID=1682393 RepID=A0A9P9BV46_9PEZI|nr:uncharacterized protein B0I36DRAFT_315571 [Microdochium trichocladiopsis]KAH7038114.1 hypothetical protein B0I36DRAFT_315571 [Microdochium trichocladiopsis]
MLSSSLGPTRIRERQYVPRTHERRSSMAQSHINNTFRLSEASRSPSVKHAVFGMRHHHNHVQTAELPSAHDQARMEARRKR